MTNRQDGPSFTEHCEKIINSLPIRFPFELTAFLAAVGEQRGVPIALWRMTPGRCRRTGMLLRTYQQIYVLVASKTDPVHVSHIAFHELGHLLLGHGSDRACAKAGRLRVRCGSEDEEQAERFAYLLSAHVRAGAARHRRPGSRAQEQLRAAFGSRRHLCGGHA